VKDVLKDRFEKVVAATYEVTDPTIDSQAQIPSLDNDSKPQSLAPQYAA
jgi:hypothetical protein